MTLLASKKNKRWQRLYLAAGGLTSLVLVMICFLDNGYNLLTDDQRGYRMYQKEQFDRAAQQFRSPQWRGAAFYRDGRFEDAAASFAAVDSPEGALNGGNSLVMLGKYQDAIVRYERALTLKPDWQPAKTNLAIARARAKSLEKSGGEMTGGKLGADEYVFSDNSSKNEGGEESVEGVEASEAEQRAIWLRQVQTKPADFLRTKFAYQYQMGDVGEPDDSDTEPKKGRE